MLRLKIPLCVAVSLVVLPSIASGEILALANYETKSPDSLKVLKSPVAAPARKEGIAVIDVDPASKTFGKIVQDIALPGDLVAHHIFCPPGPEAKGAGPTSPMRGRERLGDHGHGPARPPRIKFEGEYCNLRGDNGCICAFLGVY